MTLLTLRDVSLKIGQTTLLSSITLSVLKGQKIGIVGPNGAGKSSLLKVIAKQIPYCGDVQFENQKQTQFSNKEWAQKVGILSQKNEIPDYFTVRDVVLMGTYPSKRWWEMSSQKDVKKVEKILKQLQLLSYADRLFQSLSGGEQQRVLVARIIAQAPQVILLDEPTNHLDVFHQVETLNLIQSQFDTIIAVFHDLNMAKMFCDSVIVLQNGQIVQHGIIDSVLSTQSLNSVFHVEPVLAKNEQKELEVYSFYHHLRRRNKNENS